MGVVWEVIVSGLGMVGLGQDMFHQQTQTGVDHGGRGWFEFSREDNYPW